MREWKGGQTGLTLPLLRHVVVTFLAAVCQNSTTTRKRAVSARVTRAVSWARRSMRSRRIHRSERGTTERGETRSQCANSFLVNVSLACLLACFVRSIRTCFM